MKSRSKNLLMRKHRLVSRSSVFGGYHVGPDLAMPGIKTVGLFRMLLLNARFYSNAQFLFLDFLAYPLIIT